MSQASESKADEVEQLCNAAKICIENNAARQAKQIYKKACRLDPDCIQALNGLGEIYASGKGVLFGWPIFWLAEYYLEKAKALGHSKAALNLGLLYLKRAHERSMMLRRDSTDNDYSLALQAYTKADMEFLSASDDQSEACFQIGNLALFGVGLRRSQEVAMIYFRRAAAAGHEEAKRVIDNPSFYKATKGYPYTQVGEYFTRKARLDGKIANGETGAVAPITDYTGY